MYKTFLKLFFNSRMYQIPLRDYIKTKNQNEAART